ncbi:MAG TPA: CheR family methyltransferase [Candidatus Binatia bacterium]|nr:CheR family methyltransferase [Candidatus Binatia bacterium]
MTHQGDGPVDGHLVVVGSSAGGIEALSVLASGLGKDFSAPVVLAQHLDPSRPSQLAGILERRTDLPVVTVTGDTVLEPGTIYVVPANRHVLIRDGMVALGADQADRPRPSIDLLLSTAARSYADKLIAVILTGSGSDGAAGAVEVKEHGGTVVIQNPKTAAHPSMPSALPPTVVDHVCDLEEIAALLRDILSGAIIEKHIETVDRGALDEILTMVSRHGDVDFRQYKSATILRRISRRIAVNHLQSIDEYRDLLAVRPQEIDDLIRSLLIKVTDFFRDGEAFEFLEQKVMPDLIEAGRARGRVLRFWCAGCATGEESYSLALLVAHALGQELPEWSVRIFATDADEEAIAFARRGFYPPTVLKNLPEEYRNQFFEASDQGYRVIKQLRQMMIFGQQDLSRGVPFPRIDLVTCRNVLIYFRPELQQAVLDLFAYSLHRTHGYLFLGKAETARPSRSTYEIVQKRFKIYRCVTGPMPMPVRPPDGRRVEGAPDMAAAPERRSASEPHGDDGESRRIHEALLRTLPLGVCVIDRSYRIQSINAAARRLLGVREAGTEQDFLHTVRGLPYDEVRAAIDRTFRERSISVLPQIEMREGLGEARYLALQIVPMEGQADIAIVSVENVTELAQMQRRMQAVQSEQTQLASELSAANRRLTDMNQNLQDANEELQAANEEMMLTQEELQATNEEFEATNEELQATNEELETGNEELQATNEELETTNDELQARTSELQEMARNLTGERHRLSEIVERSPLQVLLLRGPAMIIETMNPQLAMLVEGSPAAGRRFEEACVDPALGELRAGVRRAYSEARPWQSGPTRLVFGEEERQLEFLAVPTHDADDVVDGIALYVEDVTARRRMEEAERLEKLKLMLEGAEQVALAMFEASGGRLVDANRRYFDVIQRLRGLGPDEARGQDWRRLWLQGEDTSSRFAEVLAMRKPLRLDEIHVGEGNDTSVWDCSLIPIASAAGGSVDHVILSAVEVTRSVLAREQLEQLDRLKDNFLSLASHELRTPLTPLSAYAEVLANLIVEKRRDADWEARANDVVSKFRRQVAYMSRLTEDLVDLARLRSGQLSLEVKPVELRRVLEQARDQSAMESTAAPVELEAAPGVVVLGDEMRLVQVAHNILSNALKHATGTDRVVVSTRTRSENGTRWGRVEVADDGPGIPAAYRGDLFQRFLRQEGDGRAARGGLGLGLFIAARIVEQHGGRIGAEHRDPGTTIWFEVPLAP